MNDEERLWSGQTIISGGKVLSMCFGCGKIINEVGFFRGIHLCATDEELPAARQFLINRCKRLRIAHAHTRDEVLT